MKQLKQAVRQSISEGNWYCALAAALILPDICSSLDNPEIRVVKTRYLNWYNSYIKEKYTGIGGRWNEEKEYVYDENAKSIFLSGEDCYALRCAYLHNGLDEITEQKARESLNKFLFVTPPKAGESSKHLIRTTTCYDNRRVLQLQIDIFCEDICSGVDEWEAKVATQKYIQEKVGQLLTIYEG
ncbi:hypothetical protein [Nostoc sp. GT001]|uniref:hypothetical protein n=1 Tax=Nostoc sp. GT001 TaxID=3056647 RepID=UPI0025AB524F|nr:hypothetical protein [Nostoc sp. GT001]MDM9584495.1 hypothetical protein [Nostoc sp. GT001]